MTFEQIKDIYRLLHGEDNETIDAIEEQALKYMYNQLVVYKSQDSLDNIIEMYRNEFGEDGMTIDTNEELALEFVFNTLKKQ